MALEFNILESLLHASDPGKRATFIVQLGEVVYLAFALSSAWNALPETSSFQESASKPPLPRGPWGTSRLPTTHIITFESSA